MPESMSKLFHINRRYSRSINVERDLDRLEALDGYLLTERAIEALRRIIAGFSGISGESSWTLTGVYGTGKSAFGQYLASLCSSTSSKLRQIALTITKNAFASDDQELNSLNALIPSHGFFRAVATSQREPISNTILRALDRGTKAFEQQELFAKSSIPTELSQAFQDIQDGKKIESSRVLTLVHKIHQVSQTDILLIIDELGKNLEFAAFNRGSEDLYLLQQLAELSQEVGSRVFIVALLHQSFSDYGHRLGRFEANEWAKIQGRFENILFTESSEQMVRLIGQAIDQSKAVLFHPTITVQSQQWRQALHHELGFEEFDVSIFANAYPIHPFTALVIPKLCTRYAQNDRSLFTFLSSFEPFSLQHFLEEHLSTDGQIPLLKLDYVYDYFIESVGIGRASRPNLQRWVEIHDVIQEAKNLDEESLRLLKVIGVLNLTSSNSNIRAGRQFVSLSLCDSPMDTAGRQYWETKIDNLLQRGLITYRRQLDELRIWEGSDFNVEKAISAEFDKLQVTLLEVLSTNFPLSPLIAQRHSFVTGTIRYFERIYVDESTKLANLKCQRLDSDGIIGYWLDEVPPTEPVPALVNGQKPLVLVCGTKLELLKLRAMEAAALTNLQHQAVELHSDGVARREVAYRLDQSIQLLKESLFQTFSFSDGLNQVWILGNLTNITSVASFRSKLSDVCDQVYVKGVYLQNELINRRELTAQAAKARRELIRAMLECPGSEQLGLKGNGPEVSMYVSLLEKTGIHRQENGVWGFHSPQDTEKFKIQAIWNEIKQFCFDETAKPRSVETLFRILEYPPYGVKRGIIPVLLTAILIQYVNEICVYRDGTFIPLLGAEHFEVLVKDPSRFAVKHYSISGIRASVFLELESIIFQQSAPVSQNLRNATLLSIVKPLLRFVRKLPAYTIQTKSLSANAQAVLRTLLQSQEPDELIFTSLPKACGLKPFTASSKEDPIASKTYGEQLNQLLREIQTAYEVLLEKCHKLLYEAFSVQSLEGKLREELRVRSTSLIGQCVEKTLKRFIIAATDEVATDREWIEALLMVISNKPADSWTDEYLLLFESHLIDLSRRFKNLEAVQKEMVSVSQSGFDGRRITVTRPDGKEVHRMVWFDQQTRERLEAFVEEFLANQKLMENSSFREVFIAILAEKALQ